MSKELSDFEAGKLVQSVENIESSIKAIEGTILTSQKTVNRRLSNLERFQSILTGGIIILPSIAGIGVAAHKLFGG
jgi:hypothetical protein